MNHTPQQQTEKKIVLLKNHCNKMCWNAQRQHIPKSDKYGDPVQVWKCLMSLGIDQSRANCTSKDVDFLNS